MAYAFLGRFDEGIASGTKALRFAKDIEHLPSRAESVFLLAGLFSIKGDGKNAIQHGKAAIEYCTAAGTDLFLPLANLYLGCGYFYLGELRTADRYLKSALQLQKDMGLQMFTSWVYSNLGYIDMELGNLESAKSHAENALSSSQKTNEKMFEGFAWTLLGRLLRKEEPTQFDKAEEYILKGIKLLEKLKLKAYISQGYYYLGDLYNDMGLKDEALKQLKKAEGMFREMEMDYHLSKTRDVLERV